MITCPYPVGAKHLSVSDDAMSQGAISDAPLAIVTIQTEFSEDLRCQLQIVFLWGASPVLRGTPYSICRVAGYIGHEKAKLIIF